MGTVADVVMIALNCGLLGPVLTVGTVADVIMIALNCGLLGPCGVFVVVPRGVMIALNCGLLGPEMRRRDFAPFVMIALNCGLLGPFLVLQRFSPPPTTTTPMSELFDYLTYPFVQRAILGGVMIALNCGLLGPFLVLQRLSPLSDGYGHIAFAGVAIGIILGVHPLVTASIVVLLGGAFVRWSISQNIFGEAAISLLTSLGIGAGIILIGVAGGFTEDLYSYLIGSLFTIAPDDIAYIAGALFCTLCFLTFCYRDIFMITFNQDLAALTQKRFVLAKHLFTILIVLNVVITIRAVGLLLVSSMTVIPTLIALVHAPSMRTTLLYSSMSALIGVIVGLGIALLTNIPPGGTIVITLLFFFMLSRIRRTPTR